MSRTVDERVVSMKFDNARFEKNAKATISTVEKLTQSLKFEGASKGFEAIDKAAKSVSLDGIAAGVEALQKRFSTFGIVGMRAIENITDSMMNLANKTISFLKNSIVQGGIKRAMNIENAHFQLQGLLNDEEKVQAVMSDAMDSVDGTAYAYDSAAKAASQFAASGMRAGAEMQSALRAITGVAAMTNSEYEDISRVFTTVAGNGRVMGDQLLQLSSRGLNAAATLADYLTKTGKGAKVTEADVREMVSKGQISFQTFAAAMDDAFGAHAKKANETFTGAFSNMKAALGRIGAEFISPLVVQNGALVQLFNALRVRFNDVKANIGPLADLFVGSVTKMAESLTELLKQVDLTTRFKIFYNVVDALKNVFNGLRDAVKPIKSAFAEIFTTKSTDVLLAFTESVKNLTSHFKLNDKASKNLKNTFKGLFAVLDIVAQAIAAVLKNVTPLLGGFSTLGGGILGVTGTLGKYITKLDEAVKKSDIFNKVIGGVVGVVCAIPGKVNKVFKAITGSTMGEAFEWISQKAGAFLDKMREVFDGIGKIETKGIDNLSERTSKAFKPLTSLFDGVIKILSGVWNFIKGLAPIFSALLSAVDTVFKAIGDIVLSAVENFNLDTFLNLLNGGILASIGIGIKKFVDSLDKVTKNASGFIASIKGILNAVKNCFAAWEKDIKVGTLLKIAKAIGILTLSLLVLSAIDPNKLGAALGAITALFAELVGYLAIFDKIGGNFKGASKAITLMVGLSVAVLILSSALKKLSDLSWEGVGKGLTGILGVTTILVVAAKIMDSEYSKITKFAGQMLIMSVGISILSTALRKLSDLSWEGIGKGLTGILGITTILVAAAKIMDSNSARITKFAGQMLIMSVAINVLVPAVKKLSVLSWEELAKGGAGLLGITTILVAAAKIMSAGGKKMVKGAGQMLIMSAAIAVVAAVLKKLSALSWEELAKGLVAIGGAVAILAIGLNAMKGTLAGSAAMLIAAVALGVLTPILVTLGKMSWGSIAKGLITIAGAFAIIGIAGLVLKPVIGTILALSAAVVLFGVGCLTAGVGILTLSAGLMALSTVTVAAASAIVTTLRVLIEGILGLIPAIIDKLTDAVVAICEVIIRSIPAIGKAIKAIVLTIVDVLVECIPNIVDGALKLVVGVLDALVKYTPQIVDRLFDFLIAIIDGLGRNVPKLIKAFVEMLMSIFNGSLEALGQMDIDVLIKGIACIGALTAIALALAALAAVIPAAMLGVVGLGAVVAELAFVIAAVGKLSEIPGLDWLVLKGGDLLEEVGNAIGKFVGGIVGGIAEGITSSLPNIATDLSNFMTNLQPFIEGASRISPSMFDGVLALTGVILALTAAEILDGIASWITGGSSMASFAEELVPFGEALVKFSKTVAGKINEQAVTAAANAGKIIAKMASELPNSGGVLGFFAGENDLSDFAEQLIPFGEAIAEFSKTVSGNIDEGAITATANACQTLAELAQTIPNCGGLVAAFAGDNDLAIFAAQLIPFGEAIKEFSATVSGNIDVEAVVAAANAGKTMVELAKTIPNCGGVVSFFTGDNDLSSFGTQLVWFGEAIKEFSATVSGNVDEDAVTAAANAGKAMSEMQSTLPKTGGVVQFFTGSQDLETFGTQLLWFGKGIRAFSEEISGNVDEGAVTAAANAGKAMSEMQSTLPNTGGVVQFFTGSQDLGMFGTQLLWFGKGIRAFSEEISGNIDEDAVTAAANAGKAMSEMQATIPNTGGVVQFFTGSQNLSTFGQQLSLFGKGIRAFSEEISGNIDEDAVTAAANAGKAMSEMQSTLPKTGGVVQFFSGSQDLGAFGTQLLWFGKGIRAFSEEISGNIDEDAVTAAANAGKAMSEMQSTLPKTGGVVSFFTGDCNMSTFGEQLVKFGKGITAFSEEVSGNIDKDAVTAAASAGKTMAEMAATIQSSKDCDLTTIATGLVSLGKAMVKFSTDIDEIDTSELATNVDCFKKAINKLKSVGEIGFKELVDTFEKAELRGISSLTEMLNSMTSTISKCETTFEDSGKKAMFSFAKGLKTENKNVSDIFRTTLKELVALIRSYRNEFYDAGDYLVKGFAAGIGDNIRRAVEKAQSMARAAANAAKKELNEHSPSKVGYQIGDFFGVAFVNALADYASKSYKAGAEIAKSAKSGLSDAISKIAEYIDSDVDTQPTIRPVLDLSNVERGTARLNTMFNRSQALSISASMNRATEPENQNGTTASAGNNTYNLVQNNYSPKALSRLDIYRQTKNQFSALKEVMGT